MGMTILLYIIAGTYNFSILIFSKFFQNQLFDKYDAEHFSFHGIISILLWGLAYMSISKIYQKVPYLNLVFAVEKFYYFWVWMKWMKSNSYQLGSMLSEDPLNGLFFTVYGIGDLLFGLAFLTIGLSTLAADDSEKNEKKK